MFYISRRNVFIWSATTTAIAAHQTRALIISASILALFRTYVDTELIAPRSIIVQCVSVNLAVQAIRILDALQFSIAKVTRSAQPAQRAMEVYARVN